jgi:LacI family transcriptional regulator
METLRRPTIRDIARKAGVSHTSVALALRKHASIPLKTRDRILAIAREMKYRPDPLLSALAAYRRSAKPARYQATLGWIDNSPSREAFLKISKTSPLYQNAVKHAEKLGYCLEPFWWRDPKNGGLGLSKILRTRGINGLLIGPQSQVRTHLHFTWDYFSVVSFGYGLTYPRFHSVSAHPFHGMILLIRKLRSLGYRRLSYCMSAKSDARTEHQWKAVFVMEQERVAPKQRIAPFLPQQFTKQTFLPWFQKVNPEVIITHDCIPVIEWLQTLRKRVPRDVGVATPTLQATEKGVSGISRVPHLIAEAAVDCVVGMLQRSERGAPSNPQRILIESSWVQGSTVKRLTH